MSLLIKKLFFSVIFNSCLFMLLFIGIQNSSNKSKVNLLIDETIELPISFIVGSSFILGSILGSFIVLDINKRIKIDQRAIKFSAQTILEIPFPIRIGAAILKTSVFGTLSTF